MAQKLVSKGQKDINKEYLKDKKFKSNQFGKFFVFSKVLLKQKIAIIVVFIGLLSAVAIGGVIFLYLDKILLDNKKNEIAKLTIEQSHEIQLIFDNNQLFTKMLGTRTRVKEFLLDRSEARRTELDGIFLDYLKNDNKKYQAIYLLDTSGLTLISTDPRFVGQNYSFRDYFQETIVGLPTTEALIGKTSQEFGYYFSYPIIDGAKILGVIMVKVDPSNTAEAIMRSEIAKSNIVMLTDSHGVILESSLPERRFKSLGILSDSENQDIAKHEKFFNQIISPLQYDLVQDIIRNYDRPRILDFYDQEDRDREIFGIVKIGDYPFYLVTETRLETVTSQVLPIVLVVILIVLLGLLFKSVSIYYAMVVSLRPLEKFKIFIQKASQGDFSQKIDVRTNDEFYDLSLSINKMAENLDDLYKNLDNKVKIQTHELDLKAKEADNQKKAIINILEDVAKEKEKTELLARDLEKFKLAVDNASDHIVITDPDGIIVYANKGVEKITGFKISEVIGKKAGSKDSWGGIMSNDTYRKLWDTIKNKKKVYIGSLRNRRKNGQEYEVIASISPILNASGRVLFFVGIERDVTKEKEVDRAKTEFVSLASHQLRTPLSAVNWYTEMLINGDAGKINKEQKQYLEEIYRGNQRMVELVNSLLNVSRLELGTFMVEPEVIDLIQLAKDVIRELSPQIKSKKLILKDVYDSKLNKYSADPKLMKIILQNLLSNAVKYTPSGGKVALKVSRDDKYILIEVKDTGYGITESQQDKIFTKLFRADNVREKDTEGTGLGLYLVKSIVDGVGGKVWFESEENKGSKFYVTLPVKGMMKKVGTKSLN